MGVFFKNGVNLKLKYLGSSYFTLVTCSKPITIILIQYRSILYNIRFLFFCMFNPENKIILNCTESSQPDPSQGPGSVLYRYYLVLLINNSNYQSPTAYSTTYIPVDIISQWTFRRLIDVY